MIAIYFVIDPTKHPSLLGIEAYIEGNSNYRICEWDYQSVKHAFDAII